MIDTMFMSIPNQEHFIRPIYFKTKTFIPHTNVIELEIGLISGFNKPKANIRSIIFAIKNCKEARKNNVFYRFVF